MGNITGTETYMLDDSFDYIPVSSGYLERNNPVFNRFTQVKVYNLRTCLPLISRRGTSLRTDHDVSIIETWLPKFY